MAKIERLTKDESGRRLAARLAALRKAGGMTQVGLAASSGTSVSHIRAMEAGRFDTTLFTVVTLSNGLGILPSEYLRQP